MNNWLSIVGIGEDGYDALSPAARTLVEQAAVCFGGSRHLAMLPEHISAVRRPWASPLRETIASIRQMESKPTVVLASGDPMHYGIGVTLCREFGANNITILPAPGAFTLAAARMGWPLHETACLTVHGRPLDRLNLFLRPNAKLLILSEDRATPRLIVDLLNERGFGDSAVTVLSHMGGAQETRFETTACNGFQQTMTDLNTVAVQCCPAPTGAAYSTIAGLPDDAFEHDGQLTKQAVRAVTLARLAPHPPQMLWDLGAGCGSISIEWMRAGGEAIAVERQETRCGFIAHNAARLGVPAIDIRHENTSDVLERLPAPDAIFIGGGLNAPDLVDRCWAALKPGGRLVANAVSVEGETVLFDAYRTYNGSLTRIAVSTAAPVGKFHGWRAAMPVTQFTVTKP